VGLEATNAQAWGHTHPRAECVDVRVVVEVRGVRARQVLHSRQLPLERHRFHVVRAHQPVRGIHIQHLPRATRGV
jgi:hypothetical protein